MRMKKWITVCIVLGVAISGVAALRAEDEETPSIKEVMKKAHAGAAKSLISKVAAGKGSEEDKKALLALYEALAKNKPPKGDEEAWKTRTSSMVKAAKAAVDGDEDAGKELTKISRSCAACHAAHKPKS
jgi:mono/diheme cytochrome c family protein